jgi:hypothetical protein
VPPPIDAKTVRCPKPGCEAGVDEPCIRLSGTYGLGNPLRKAHNERWVAAHQAADRRAFGWNRRRSGRVPARQPGPEGVRDGHDHRKKGRGS